MSVRWESRSALGDATNDVRLATLKEACLKGLRASVDELPKQARRNREMRDALDNLSPEKP
jgi:hypothetical protein